MTIVGVLCTLGLARLCARSSAVRKINTTGGTLGGWERSQAPTSHQLCGSWSPRRCGSWSPRRCGSWRLPGAAEAVGSHHVDAGDADVIAERGRVDDLPVADVDGYMVEAVVEDEVSWLQGRPGQVRHRVPL